MVVKYADNVIKGFATSTSSVLTALVSCSFQHFSVSKGSRAHQPLEVESVGWRLNGEHVCHVTYLFSSRSLEKSF